MGHTLKIKRNQNIYSTYEEATAALDAITLSDGEPISVRYYDNDTLKTIFAIGTIDGYTTVNNGEILWDEY